MIAPKHENQVFPFYQATKTLRLQSLISSPATQHFIFFGKSAQVEYAHIFHTCKGMKGESDSLAGNELMHHLFDTKNIYLVKY